MRIRVLSQGRAVLGGAICLICAAAFAQQDVVTVSACPSEVLPVAFQVDCSNVANPEAKETCKSFEFHVEDSL